MGTKEDKQLICDKLLETLKELRGFQDLKELKYDAKEEIITAVYTDGYTLTFMQPERYSGCIVCLVMHD